MQNNFSLVFLNSLVPPNDNMWCTNARYKSTVSRVGCILIFHTWSLVEAIFSLLTPIHQGFFYVTTGTLPPDYLVYSHSVLFSEPRQ